MILNEFFNNTQFENKRFGNPEPEQQQMDADRRGRLGRERNAGLDEPDDAVSGSVQTGNGVYEYTVPAGQESTAQELGLQQHRGHWVSRVPIQRANFQFGRPQFHEIPVQGVAEGVALPDISGLGYNAQSLIMKLRRDVEEKRLQPTPQAVLAAARELAGDMEFAPQLLVKQVLGQGVAEGKDDKIAQLKKDHDTAVHWSKNETSPQKREAARQKAEKIKRHLDTQYKQGVAEGSSTNAEVTKRAKAAAQKAGKTFDTDVEYRLWYAITTQANAATRKADKKKDVAETKAHSTNHKVTWMSNSANKAEHFDSAGAAKAKVAALKQSGQYHNIKYTPPKGMAEGSEEKTPGVALSKAYQKDFDGKKPVNRRPETALTGTYSKTGKPGGELKKRSVTEDLDIEAARERLASLQRDLKAVTGNYPGDDRNRTILRSQIFDLKAQIKSASGKKSGVEEGSTFPGPLSDRELSKVGRQIKSSQGRDRNVTSPHQRKDWYNPNDSRSSKQQKLDYLKSLKGSQGVAEAATPASVSKVLRLIDRHHPEWFDNYGMGEVEDTVVDMAEQGQFQGMSAQDAMDLVAQELESLYGPQGMTEAIPDVDHMHGPRGINLPVADTRDILQKPFEFYGNYKEWAHDVDRVNSELLDDNAEYTSMAGGKTISINGKDFAFWSNRNGNGSIDVGIAKKHSGQGVGEGVDDLKNIDPGELAGSTLGGIAGYMAGDALGGPMVGFGAAGVGSAVGGALAKEGMMDNPGQEDSPVAQAIIRRILLQRTDLLAKHGPEKVGQAVDEVADFVGDVDEIGSSDVSGWVRHVEQMLGNMTDGSVTKKPQPYNDPNWIKNLPKEKLDALAGARYKTDKKDPKVAEGRDTKRALLEKILKG